MSLDLVRTLAAVAVPIVVAVIGYWLNQRIKRYEASQWRNQELITARLQYYGQIAPMLNDLMCYLTFIGRWKEFTPPQVVAIKRDADRLFHTVAPLFSADAVEAYEAFMEQCFSMNNQWGTDARIRSGFGRRRDASGKAWRSEWEDMFTHRAGDQIAESDMDDVRAKYDRAVAALVKDIELLEPRQRYAPSGVYVNAR